MHDRILPLANTPEARDLVCENAAREDNEEQLPESSPHALGEKRCDGHHDRQSNKTTRSS
jgi:hypothetical protein